MNYARLLNSYEYERHAFEAAGGDSWMDPRRVRMLAEFQKGDPIWEKAIRVSEEVYGTLRGAFVAFMFKRLGGRL